MENGENAGAITKQKSGLRPPWKPGQSGNPSGRPKKPLTERLISKLVREDSAEADRIIESLIASASDKDSPWSVRAASEIFDRVEGKVPQALTGEDGGAVRLQFEVIHIGSGTPPANE